MTQHVALQFAAKTDTGLVRSHNEDAIELNEACRIAVLADGMGGYNAGEVASGIATSVFQSALDQRLRELHELSRVVSNKVLQRLMSESVVLANAAILDAARDQPEFSGMGTTLVAALFYQSKVILAHVGDSRAYRFRQGVLVQLTHDHSQLQEQIDAGLVSPEWARFAPNKNLITRALGVMPQVAVDTSVHAVEAGDIYLLCSDGLSDMLSHQQMVELCNCEEHPQLICDHLVEAANNNGGRDNISVVLIKIDSIKSITPSPLRSRIMAWLK